MTSPSPSPATRSRRIRPGRSRSAARCRRSTEHVVVLDTAGPGASWSCWTGTRARRGRPAGAGARPASLSSDRATRSWHHGRHDHSRGLQGHRRSTAARSPSSTTRDRSCSSSTPPRSAGSPGSTPGLQELHDDLRRPGLHGARLPLRPVRPPGARRRGRDRDLLRAQLRRHLPDVRQGRRQRRRRAPALPWLRAEQGGLLGNAIKWNFTKFLVGKDGEVIGRLRADHRARQAHRRRRGRARRLTTSSGEPDDLPVTDADGRWPMAATTSSYSITMRLHTAPDHGIVGAVATAISRPAASSPRSTSPSRATTGSCSTSPARPATPTHAQQLVAAVDEVDARRGLQGQRPDLPAAHRRQDRGPLEGAAQEPRRPVAWPTRPASAG